VNAEVRRKAQTVVLMEGIDSSMTRLAERQCIRLVWANREASSLAPSVVGAGPSGDEDADDRFSLGVIFSGSR